MNKALLTYVIARAGKNNETVAHELGISLRSMQNKMAGRTEFTASEIGALIKACELSGAEVVDIFFSDKVAVKSTMTA